MDPSKVKNVDAALQKFKADKLIEVLSVKYGKRPKFSVQKIQKRSEPLASSTVLSMPPPPGPPGPPPPPDAPSPPSLAKPSASIKTLQPKAPDPPRPPLPVPRGAAKPRGLQPPRALPRASPPRSIKPRGTVKPRGSQPPRAFPRSSPRSIKPRGTVKPRGSQAPRPPRPALPHTVAPPLPPTGPPKPPSGPRALPKPRGGRGLPSPPRATPQSRMSAAAAFKEQASSQETNASGNKEKGDTKEGDDSGNDHNAMSDKKKKKKKDKKEKKDKKDKSGKKKKKHKKDKDDKKDDTPKITTSKEDTNKVKKEALPPPKANLLPPKLTKVDAKQAKRDSSAELVAAATVTAALKDSSDTAFAEDAVNLLNQMTSSKTEDTEEKGLNVNDLKLKQTTPIPPKRLPRGPPRGLPNTSPRGKPRGPPRGSPRGPPKITPAKITPARVPKPLRKPKSTDTAANELLGTKLEARQAEHQAPGPTIDVPKNIRVPDKQYGQTAEKKMSPLDPPRKPPPGAGRRPPKPTMAPPGSARGPSLRPSRGPPGLSRGPPGSARGPVSDVVKRLPPGATAVAGPPGSVRRPPKPKPKQIDDPDAKDYHDDSENEVDDNNNDNEEVSVELTQQELLELEVSTYKMNKMKEELFVDQQMSDETIEGLKYLIGKELRDTKVQVRVAKNRVKECEEAILRDGLLKDDYRQVRIDLTRRRNQSRQRMREAIADEKEEQEEYSNVLLLKDNDEMTSSEMSLQDTIHRKKRRERRRLRKHRRKVKWVTKCLAAMQDTGEVVDRRKVELLIRIMKTLN